MLSAAFRALGFPSRIDDADPSAALGTMPMTCMPQEQAARGRHKIGFHLGHRANRHAEFAEIACTGDQGCVDVEPVWQVQREHRCALLVFAQKYGWRCR